MIREARSTDPRGWLVVSRHAGDDADRAELRREATMLGLGRHPGVIEVVRADPLGDELVTVAPTRATLADLAGGTDEALRILAAVSETVADLHALGIVHGSITAESILAVPGRPPVLDGFGRAGLAGEHDPDGRVLRPAVDVAALAGLVRSVWPSRLPRRAPHPRRGAPPKRELEQLLHDAAEGRTPPARRLARAIGDELGPRSEPRPDEPDAGDRPTGQVGIGGETAASDESGDEDPFARLRPREVPARRRPPRLVALGAGVVGVASLTWGVLGVSSGAGNPPRLAASTATTAAAASTTSPRRRVPGPVAVAHHGVLVVGPRHYLVGADDDQAIAAEWGCAGPTRLVLLRPSTGELFVFGSWARAGHDVRAAPAGRVTPGSRLSTTTDAAGCPVARTTSPDGEAHMVRVGPA